MTEVTTQTLTDFLLARIADDEEWLAFGFGCDLPHDGLVQKPDCRPRVLAECEAKRSLLALHPEAVGADLRPGAAWAFDEMLRRLALPYADHPDFRDEWRP